MEESRDVEVKAVEDIELTEPRRLSSEKAERKGGKALRVKPKNKQKREEETAKA